MGGYCFNVVANKEKTGDSDNVNNDTLPSAHSSAADDVLTDNDKEGSIHHSIPAGIYPTLEAFISDIVNKTAYFPEEYALFNMDDPLSETVPAAIWGSKVYITPAGKHMAIRPEKEKGFPDFVGSLYPGALGEKRLFDNNTGHYKTPADAWHRLPGTVTSNYRFNSSHDTGRDVVRMTMLSDPNNYVRLVGVFRKDPGQAAYFFQQYPDYYAEVVRLAEQGQITARMFLTYMEGREFKKTAEEELLAIKYAPQIMMKKNEAAVRNARIILLDELISSRTETTMPALPDALSSDVQLARFLGLTEGWERSIHILDTAKLVAKARKQRFLTDGVAPPVASDKPLPQSDSACPVGRQRSFRKKIASCFRPERQ